MKVKGYIPRIVDREIDQLLHAYGAVSIEGPKYCGKTCTSTTHASSLFALDDPGNDYINYRIASMDVYKALEGHSPHLIDEWQMIPSIWDAVRKDVDSKTGPGHYILCGSSTPETPKKNSPDDKRIKGYVHSGFGRITTVHMRTMSLMESGDSDCRIKLKDLFDHNIPITKGDRNELGHIIDLIMSGGWPGNLGMDMEYRIRAVSQYPNEICVKDLPRVDDSKSPSRMMMLLRSLARNESTLASATTISRDIKEFDDEKVSDDSVRDYLAVLERMNLIEDQPAFNPNLRSSVRVGKSPKRHLTDPALSIAAMGWSKEMLISDLNTLGFMFEAMCERDLQIYSNSLGGKLYHYRDGKGREIDAVVELPDRRWGAFEIKLGSNQIDEAAENLVKIDEMIRNDENGRPPEFLCVICGLEGATYQREDGVHVVPITSLGC